MKILQISCSLFSTIVVSAYYTNSTVYHHLYLVLVVCGIFNHGLERKNDNSRNIIHNIDRIFAKSTFLYTLYESYNHLFMTISLLNVSILYLLEYKYPQYDTLLHLLIHIYIISLMNFYILFYKNNNLIIE